MCHILMVENYKAQVGEIELLGFLTNRQLFDNMIYFPCKRGSLFS